MGALDGDEAHQFSVRWRKVLADNGFIGITWPVAYGGGGRSKLDQIILARNSPAPASRSAG